MGLANGLDDAGQGSKGVKLQCSGKGEPQLSWALACNLPPLCYRPDGSFRWGVAQCAEGAAACPPASEVEDGNVPPLAQAANLFTFLFGDEPYDLASVTACCSDQPPPPDVATRTGSCEASCSKMSCTNVNGYIEYLRSDDTRLAAVCCQFDTDACPGQFDCLDGGDDEAERCGPHGPLLEVCQKATAQWLADTAHDAWSRN